MTATRYVTIWCDGDGCGDWIGQHEHTAVAARVYARNHGWGRKVGNDLCPACLSSTALSRDFDEPKSAPVGPASEVNLRSAQARTGRPSSSRVQRGRPTMCDAIQPTHEVQCMLPEGHDEPHDSMVGIRWL